MQREPEQLLNPGRSPLIAGLLTCPLTAAGDALSDPSQCVLAPFKRDPTFDPLTDAAAEHQWAINGVTVGNDGWFQVPGNLTETIYPGFMVNVSDGTGNDLYYGVKSVTQAGANTRIGVQFVRDATVDGTLTLIVPHHALTEGLIRFVNRDTSASAGENTLAIIGWNDLLKEHHWLVLGCGANPT